MGAVPVIPVFPAGLPVAGATGTNNLQLLCTALTWRFTGRPVAELTQGIAQSVAATTVTAVTWDTKVQDRDSGWSNAHNTRYTAQTPGIYLLAAAVAYASSGTGDRQTWFQVTTGANNPLGAGVTTSFGYATYSSGGICCAETKMLTPYMYVLDYVEVETRQNSGGALLTTLGSPGPSWFTIEHVSG